jgi:hypothetical protein
MFEKFRDGLPDDWLVLHSRRFALPGGRGSGVEKGEIDFHVLDPARGLLALEVKGGGELAPTSVRDQPLSKG